MGSIAKTTQQQTTNKATCKATVNMMSESRVPMTIRDFFFDDPFFKSSWDNFDQVQEKMFEESRDMWKKFDQDFRSMACMSNNVMVNSNMKQQQSTNKSVATTELVGQVGERMDVPPAVDAAQLEERVQGHGPIQGEGQRGHPCEE